MKKLLLAGSICLFAIQLQAQNLVPNGDLELYCSCPSYVAQIDSCSHWMSTSYFTPGADYFNRCSTSSFVSVPKNYLGFQEPHSGNGYAGIAIYSPSQLENYREYIEVPLKQNLEQNTCYHISFYINLSNSSKLSSNNIGAYFSNNEITGVNCSCPLPYTPQFFYSGNTLPDTINWTLIEGNIVASGGEQVLILGNFNFDNITDVYEVNSEGWFNEVYLYIDDVSVYKCNTSVYTANAGADRDLCRGSTATLEMQHLSEYKYQWYTINGSPIDTSNTIEVSPTTTTKYVLWVRDFKYEESWDTVTVNVINDCENENEIEIPNLDKPEPNRKNE